MQTPLGLTTVGLLVIFVTVGILIRGRVNPIIPMTLVPVVGALVCGFGLGEISDFFSEGLSSVINVVVMFIFAIIFFGILQDVGLFTPVIRALIKATRGKIMAVTLGTAAIGVVAHLDGSGSTTFLITIPALLPLYRALNMSRYVLITIVAMAASIMNMVPLGRPAWPGRRRSRSRAQCHLGATFAHSGRSDCAGLRFGCAFGVAGKAPHSGFARKRRISRRHGSRRE